jgi:hypothetical protein
VITRIQWRDLAVAFSLATLCTMRAWLPVWNDCYQLSYAMKSIVTVGYVLASLVTLCAFAAGIFVAAWACRSFPWRPARIAGELALVVALCIPLNAARSVFGKGRYALSRYAILTSFNDWPAVLLLALVILLLYGFWRYRQSLARLTYAALLLLFPLFPLNLFHLLWSATGSHSAAPERVAGPIGPAPSATRVVWMLFDEWDYGISFADRPHGLRLPALDALRAESLFASNVSSPSWQTRVSVPALTTGMLLKSVAEQGRSEVRLTPLEGGGEVRWSSTATVFSEARALGFNTSIVGAYLPYCRVLGRELSTCWWSESPNLVSGSGSTLASMTVGQIRSVFETQNFSPFGVSLLSTGYDRMYREVLSNTEATLLGQATGLIYLHFPIPHPPTIYNASTGATRARSEGARGYLDNLVLVDKTVQRLRELMTEAGTWKHTTLLLTSDHWYREATLLGSHDRRVPFLIKLAGDATPAIVNLPFNNVVTRDLIVRVLRGEVRTNADAVAWLGRVPAGGATRSEKTTRTGHGGEDSQ